MTLSREGQFCVYLHDKLVGRLHRRDNVTRFVFDEDYWNDPNRDVLGLRFEEDPRARHRSNMRLPPWFSNLLPEGRLREWIALSRRTSIEREMELLAPVGHDLPGAVRVLAADQIVPVDVDDGSDLNGRQKATDSLWSFSLAGVGLKFSMLARGDRLVIPSRGEGGDWIVKLPDPIYPDVPWNELAMMTLAKAVGIDVPEVRLLHRDQIDPLPERVWSGCENHAFAVKRFDRGPGRELIHIEDMAQVRGFYPDDKYLGAFETVGALVYRQRDIKALREFARRLAFSIIIGNGDAHLKSWSLIYLDSRTPTLAPAYDLVATFVYRPSSEGVEDIALSFGRSKRFEDMRISSFDRLDEKLGAKAELGDVARMLVDRVLSEWPRAAALLEGHPELCRRIELFVKERSRQLIR